MKTAGAPEVMTAGMIARRLATQHFRPFHQIVLPRYVVGDWEADLFAIQPSGWAEEVEIKVSWADYLSEWRCKSEKHRALREGVMLCAGIVQPNGGDVEWRPGFSWETPGLVQKLTFLGRRYVYATGQPHVIRRYWLAAPMELAERIASHAPPEYGVFGLGSWIKTIRPARNLERARKVTEAEKLAALKRIYCRVWSAEMAGNRPLRWFEVAARNGGPEGTAEGCDDRN